METEIINISYVHALGEGNIGIRKSKRSVKVVLQHSRQCITLNTDPLSTDLGRQKQEWKLVKHLASRHSADQPSSQSRIVM